MIDVSMWHGPQWILAITWFWLTAFPWIARSAILIEGGSVDQSWGQFIGGQTFKLTSRAILCYVIHLGGFW